MNFQSQIALKSGLLFLLMAARVYPFFLSKPVDYSCMIQSTGSKSSRLLYLIASCAIHSAFNLSTRFPKLSKTCRHDPSSRLVPDPVVWIASVCCRVVLRCARIMCAAWPALLPACVLHGGSMMAAPWPASCVRLAWIERGCMDCMILLGFQPLFNF